MHPNVSFLVENLTMPMFYLSQAGSTLTETQRSILFYRCQRDHQSSHAIRIHDSSESMHHQNQCIIRICGIFVAQVQCWGTIPFAYSKRTWFQGETVLSVRATGRQMLGCGS
jgi:hypothetical protein